MTSHFEHYRERMMEEKAHDLPFGRSGKTAAKWGILAGVVLLGLVVPFFYIGFGLIGALTTSEAGLWVSGVGLIASLVLFGAVSYYAITRSEAYAPDSGVKEDAVRLNSNATVSSVMSTKVVFGGKLDSLEDCAKEMYRHDVGFLVIRDEADRFIGVITDRDIVCAGVAHGLNMQSTPVSLAMEHDLKSIGPNDSIESAIEIMREQGIRRLPVIENGICTGILSLDDLICGGVCGIEDVAGILDKQMSEPSLRKGGVTVDPQAA